MESPLYMHIKKVKRLFLVYSFFQFFTNFEERQLLGCNLDISPRFRVSSCVGAIVADDETAETPDFDPAVFFQLIRESLENQVYDVACFFLRQIFFPAQ